MRKVIASKNGVIYSMEERNGKFHFYANKEGEPYSKRVDVTPKDLPNEEIVAEVKTKKYNDTDKSERHKAFLAELERRYEEMDPLTRLEQCVADLEKRLTNLEKAVGRIGSAHMPLG